MARMPLLTATAFAVAFLSLSFASLAVAQAGTTAAEPEVITVAADKTLRPTNRKLLGINLNYLLDNDANRPRGARPLARAVADVSRLGLYPAQALRASKVVTLPAAMPVYPLDYEERLAQAVLQPLHRLRYGGGGSAQLPRGCGKTALLGGFGECDELLKSRHIRGVIMLIEEFMSLMLRCSCAFSKRACLVTLRTPYHFNWKEREPSHANPCPA